MAYEETAEEKAYNEKANKRMLIFFAIFLGYIFFMAGFHLGYYWPNPDYTMTQAQANRLGEPATVYLEPGVQEDDIYIAPEDIGRIDIERK